MTVGMTLVEEPIKGTIWAMDSEERVLHDAITGRILNEDTEV